MALQIQSPYITKTQVGNKNISDTFMVHKTKNCNEDKIVALKHKFQWWFYVDCQLDKSLPSMFSFSSQAKVDNMILFTSLSSFFQNEEIHLQPHSSTKTF